MQIEQIVERLRKVRKLKNGHYQACCPAHQDKSPSLTIQEGNGGVILLYCFAGCTVRSICDAIAIELSDLWPERDSPYVPRVKPILSAAEILTALRAEAGIVLIAAADLAERKPLSESDFDRVATACQRITTALDFYNNQ